MNILKKIIQATSVITLIISSFNCNASDLVMMRVKQSFPETMVNLQSAIKKTGYTISRVQRVDIGLTKSGFKTDKYRVVFYGKAGEVAKLTKKSPDIAAFLPLKISIFAEGNETILVSKNPVIMQNYFKEIPKSQFKDWADDLGKIFALTNVID